MNKNHFLSLDSIRGLLACNVALAHFNGNSYFRDSTIIGRGDVYVDFFFVLSGFVIFANYRDRLLSGFGVGRFMLLRLGRLYPLHFAVLMAFILIDLFQMVIHINGAAAFAPFTAPGEGIKEILANLFLVHSMHTINTLAFNGPSWSISVEIFTYLLFAIILCWAQKNYRWVIAFLSLTSAIVLFWLCGELYAKLDYGFLRCIFGFGVGALAYDFYEYLKPKLTPCISSNKNKIDILEVSITCLSILYVGYFSFGGASMFAPVLFFFVIVLFAFEGGIVSKALKAKPLVFLGVLSYSIYMIHILISGKLFMFPARLVENWLGTQVTFERNGVTMLGMDQMTGTILEILYLVVVIGCSWVSYKLIEEPCRKMTKKWVEKRAS